MAYAGTHETTKFGERDSGNAVLVEIAGPAAAPVITPVRTGGLAWVSIEEELRTPGDAARLRERVEGIADPAMTLLQLQIGGLLSPADRDALVHLEEVLRSRFPWARLDATHVRPAPEDESWVAGLPPGILRDAASTLRALGDPAYAGQRPDGASPEVAARALLELYAIVGGGGR
jgi:hypothetical protein